MLCMGGEKALNKQEIQQYWADKEQHYNEKLITKSVANYEKGHPDYPKRAFGLLFLMDKSLNFESFEKRVLLPFKKPEFKKIEFRVSLNEIKGYRIKTHEKPSLAKFWIALKNNEPSYIEVDFNFHGSTQTLLFERLVPMENWEASFAQVMESKKLR